MQILKAIVRGGAIDSGPRGYYFAYAHNISWWSVMQRLHAVLSAGDAAIPSEIAVWPNDEVAAESLGVPAPFVQPLWNAGFVMKSISELGAMLIEPAGQT